MNNTSRTWVFGYGSLIYKVDFPYLERRVASISGWERRFWQGSHDHRGTPEAPGRVVTLIPSSGVMCKGVAYLIEQTVFDHLDHREKNGYQRHPVDIDLNNSDASVPGLTYVAEKSNPAFLGSADIDELAQHIARSSGPSGSNTEYVLLLAQALRELSTDDPHVFALEARLQNLLPNAAVPSG
jgi:cation transport protein ChaC